MKLPNGESAVIDIRKIRNYCLSKDHPRGRHKARVFENALGMTDGNSEELASTLREAARKEEATAGISDPYGVRYIIDFELERNDRSATIRSCWIV